MRSDRHAEASEKEVGGKAKDQLPPTNSNRET
jgi:hypothetical protein